MTSTTNTDKTQAQGAWRVGELLEPHLLVPPPHPPSMLSFAIEIDHPLVARWPPLRDTILELLNNSPIHWSVLEVLRRRMTILPGPHDDTTVVVTATKVKQRDWTNLAQALKKKCEEHREEMLNVELIDATVERLNHRRALRYDRTPPGGSSVGVLGQENSGTLGGYILVVDEKGKQTVCGLTCHYVILPASRGPMEECSHSLEALHPSQKDCNADIETCRNGLSLLAREIADDRHDIDEYERIGRETTRKQQALKRLEDAEKALQKKIESWPNHYLHFGYVIRTSGLRTGAHGCAVDWGLIAVSEDRVGKNEVSTTAVAHLLDC